MDDAAARPPGAVARPRRRRPALSLGLVLVLTLPAAGQAGPWGIAELMARLAGNRTGEASFVESKHLAVLARPVLSSGELRYVAPNRLEKNTLRPKPESLVLDGDVLSLHRPGKPPYVVNLKDDDDILGFVDGIRATLAGDRQALERSYTLSLEGGVEDWQLVLVPQRQGMLRLVSRIRIRGHQGQVQAIGIDSPDGDRDEMQITPAPAS